MDISWRSFLSLIRPRASRTVRLLAAPGIITLASTKQDCAIRDVESVRNINLDACRPAPVTNEEKARALHSLPAEGEVSQLGGDERRKLEAIEPVLRAHQRIGIYEVRVISVQQAWTGLHERAVLLISLPALRLVNSEELAALVAHEI